jgi:hypothetical protein
VPCADHRCEEAERRLGGSAQLAAPVVCGAPGSAGTATTKRTDLSSRAPQPRPSEATRPAAILGVMGFNPFRQQRRSYADYLMVGAALVVCLGLVIWALTG